MPHQAHAPVRSIARALALVWCSVGLAQAAIYTCVDAQGRRITSDRPIAACMDREQRELSPSGSVRRVIPPEPTADERAALDAQRKAEAERNARLSEEKRRERALLSRYPNEAAHQRERAKALESVDVVEHTIQKRIEELVKLRAGLDDEMAFYAKDPAKAWRDWMVDGKLASKAPANCDTAALDELGLRRMSGR